MHSDTKGELGGFQTYGPDLIKKESWLRRSSILDAESPRKLSGHTLSVAEAHCDVPDEH